MKNKLKITSLFFVFVGIPIFIILYLIFGSFLFGGISTSENCPQGQHEEERYGRFGGIICVSNDY